MEEKRNVPKLRFPGFTDPWEQRRLGEIATVTMGQSPNGAFYTDNPSDIILVQGNADLKDGWVCPRVWTTQITKTANAGDLIMSVRAPVGAVGKTAFDVVLGRGVAGIAGDEFLYQALQKKAQDGYWTVVSAGSTFDSISGSDLRDTPIPVPSSSAERAKIGEQLRKLDSLITLHQRKLDHAKELKKGLLQKMFPKEGASVPELRFPGFTDPWEQRKLGELCSFAKGRGYSKMDICETGMPLILYGRLYTQYQTRIEEVDTFAADKGGSLLSSGNEVIVPASGETAEDIAVASSVRRPGIIFGGDLNVLTPEGALDPDYVALGITYGSAHGNLAKRAQGKSVVHVHNADIAMTELAYPGIDEQRAISSFVLSLDSLITLHQRQLDHIKELKKGLLQQMFV